MSEDLPSRREDERATVPDAHLCDRAETLRVAHCDCRGGTAQRAGEELLIAGVREEIVLADPGCEIVVPLQLQLMSIGNILGVVVFGGEREHLQSLTAAQWLCYSHLRIKMAGTAGMFASRLTE